MGQADEIFKKLTTEGYFDDPRSIPQPPKITSKKLKRCRETGDFRPILFDWYRFVGRLSNFFASISRSSPAIREVDQIHYYVLIGLLNRCSRLMLANVTLSRHGFFGETTSIIDRCIFESAIKLIWLTETRDSERFQRLIADGLKTDLELKDTIEANIASHGGDPFVIEKRMLGSINRMIRSSGMSAEEITNTKKLPDLASMIGSVGGDRLVYLVGQKIGSHHVHGTWVSLRRDYLEEKDGELVPRDHDCPTHANQYVVTCLAVLSAMQAFVSHAIAQDEVGRPLLDCIEAVKDELGEINTEMVGRDFELEKDL